MPLDWTRPEGLGLAWVKSQTACPTLTLRPTSGVVDRSQRASRGADREAVRGSRETDAQEVQDFRRYLNDLKRLYGRRLLDIYQRIASHGRAIWPLSICR